MNSKLDSLKGINVERERIKYVLNSLLKNGNNKFLIFPYGRIGMITQDVLENIFHITDYICADSTRCQDLSYVINPQEMDGMEDKGYLVLLSCSNPSIHRDVYSVAEQYFHKENICDIFDNICTKCGKYSYGPLCNHPMVKEVGAFCSFADGTDVVVNHPTQYISTHPFLYHDKKYNSAPVFINYYENNEAMWYFPGVQPHGTALKNERVVIGNDVWLGKNVLIMNGAKIGDGIIAGAGTIITKDIPAYAVVVGSPAKIIKYRYNEKEIEELEKIKWWDWSDDTIRANYEDFYLPVNEFISKHRI